MTQACSYFFNGKSAALGLAGALQNYVFIWPGQADEDLLRIFRKDLVDKFGELS